MSRDTQGSGSAEEEACVSDDVLEQPATKDIRFHARLMRLSDCIAGDPNIDEDLWAVPLAALAEIERLRTANRNLLHTIERLGDQMLEGEARRD